MLKLQCTLITSVPNKLREERLLGKICVMFGEEVGGGLRELHGHQLESLRLESGNDLTGKTTLDGIGLEHQESSFAIGRILRQRSRICDT
jgi:hypothetical protein